MLFLLGPMGVFGEWGRRLTTPFGLILLVLAMVYILLRVSGKLGGNNDTSGSSGGTNYLKL